jgi:hypothetical protein
VTVNWSFYDSFDAQGVFYTDSNGLEMQKRNIVIKKPLAPAENEKGYNYETVSANYFPIGSAIAMRDTTGANNL